MTRRLSIKGRRHPMSDLLPSFSQNSSWLGCWETRGQSIRFSQRILTQVFFQQSSDASDAWRTFFTAIIQGNTNLKDECSELREHIQGMDNQLQGTRQQLQATQQHVVHLTDNINKKNMEIHGLQVAVEELSKANSVLQLFQDNTVRIYIDVLLRRAESNPLEHVLNEFIHSYWTQVHFQTKVSFWFPSVLFVAVSWPLDQIMGLPIDELSIQDLLDVIDVILGFFGQVGCGGGFGARWCWFQQ